MKELEFLEIIKNTLDDSSFLGDDCALLKDLNIYVTHDTLVEDIHFTMYTTNAYNLGQKSVNVNLSDLAAALATPKYITVSISLPKLTKNSFVKELYRGINDACKKFNVKVIGGDITSGDKITISICAIGKKETNYNVSRKNAKKDDYIVVTGNFGESALGLHSLSNFLYADKELIEKHLIPKPRIEESKIILETINDNIAIMDCSDGLVDALYKIANASKHSIKIDINKVPVTNSAKEYCKQNNLDYKDFVKWGGEDYELLLSVPEEIYTNLNKELFTCIGTVLNKDNNPNIIIEDNDKIEKITKEIFLSKSFNHFNM